MKDKMIVVGSGISGISFARMALHTHEVCVLEKADNIGGLIKCKRIDGNLFHLVGGHVFNTRNQQVMDWFWQFFQKEEEFVKATRNSKILFNGTLIGYPIENHLYQLSPELVRQVTDELLSIAVAGTDPRKAGNFEDFLKQSFGHTLYDAYFGPYNQKIWNTDLRTVPLDWLDDKLPMPSVHEIFIHNIQQKKEEATVHSSFFYPVRNGSQFIIDRLAEGLDISTSYEVSSISTRGQKIVINNGDREADTLVYSGDVRKLHDMVKIDDKALVDALEAVTTLPANGTTNVLCECDANDLSWLYIPEKQFKAHRIIYTGNFSESNNHPAMRNTCVVEYSGKQDPEMIRQELPLLPGNLRPLSFNHEPSSYIIQDANTRSKIEEAKKQLKKYSIHLLGRFSEWEYFNMDKCMESAMALHAQL